MPLNIEGGLTKQVLGFLVQVDEDINKRISEETKQHIRCGVCNTIIPWGFVFGYIFDLRFFYRVVLRGLGA